MQTENATGTAAEPKKKAAEVKDTLGDLAEHSSDFVSNFYKLQILNLTKKATDVTANVAGGLISAVLGLFVLLFLGFALAFWLGDLLDSNALGFLITAAFFALVAGIFLAIRKRVVFPIFRNKIIRKLYE